MIEIKMTITNDEDEELEILVQGEFDSGERQTQESPEVLPHFYDIYAYSDVPVMVDGTIVFKTLPFELSPEDEKYAVTLLWEELKAIADEY